MISNILKKITSGKSKYPSGYIEIINCLEKENQTDDNLEIITLYENEILNDDESLFNLVYGGSLFSSKKIIIIQECSDKIIKKIASIYEKNPENFF